MFAAKHLNWTKKSIQIVMTMYFQSEENEELFYIQKD